MRITKTLPLILLCTCIVSTQSALSRSKMKHIAKEMDRHMQQMRQEMHALFDSFTSEAYKDPTHSEPFEDLSLTENDRSITITFQLKKDLVTFDATTKENALTISIPQEQLKISILVDGRMIKIETAMHNKEEAEEEAVQIVSFGSSSIMRTLHNKVDLNQASIEYENGQLTVTIPKVETIEDKKVDVVIKKADQKEHEPVTLK